MKKLFPHLKPMMALLLIVLVLVGAQAVAELYLPEMMSDIVNDGIYIEYEPMYAHETMASPFDFDINGDVKGFSQGTIPVFEMEDGFSTVDIRDIWNDIYPGEITGVVFKDIPVKDSRELFNEVLIPFMNALKPYQFDKVNEERLKEMQKTNPSIMTLDKWENDPNKDSDNFDHTENLRTSTPDPNDNWWYTYSQYSDDYKLKVRAAVERLFDYDTIDETEGVLSIDTLLDMGFEDEDDENTDIIDEDDEGSTNVWRDNEAANHMLVACVTAMKHSIYGNLLPIPIVAETDKNGYAKLDAEENFIPIFDENGNYQRIAVDALGQPIDANKLVFMYNDDTERFEPFPDFELIICNEVLGYAYLYNGEKWVNNKLGTTKKDANVTSMKGVTLKSVDVMKKFWDEPLFQKMLKAATEDESNEYAIKYYNEQPTTEKDITRAARRLKKEESLIISKDFAEFLYEYENSDKTKAEYKSELGDYLSDKDLIIRYWDTEYIQDQLPADIKAKNLDTSDFAIKSVVRKLIRNDSIAIDRDFLNYLYEHEVAKGYTLEDVHDTSAFKRISDILKLSEVGGTVNKVKDRESAEDYLTPDGITNQTSNYNFIWKKGIIMLSLTVLASFCAILAMFFIARIVANFSFSLRKTVFKKVEGFSLVEFDKFSTASLITRSTNDINQIQNVFLIIFRTALSTPVTIIGGIFLSMKKNVDMTMVMIYTIPLMILAAIVAAKIVYPIMRLIQQKVDQLTLIMRESLTGIRVVRAFNQQAREEKRFKLASKNTSRLAVIVARYSAVLSPLIAIGLNCTSVAIVWVAAKAVANKTVDDVGTMMAVMQYVTLIMFALIMVAQACVQWPRACASANRINGVLDTMPAIKDAEGAEDKHLSVGSVEFKNVYFKYSPEAESYILEDISFCCEKGKTTAFIGGTGSGKSSIINLIPRFYDINSGEVLINGQSVKEFPQADLRAKIGFVPQRAVLFSGSIRDNLKYGKEDATDEEIWEALRIAQSDAFVREKEDGLDSIVEQGGRNFSGGQKQRLSIARAIVRKPEIYIFDDSFSALDFKTDARLRKALSSITQESTVIIVAQRIGTIMDADTIVVLHQGKIVGKGKHEDLIQNCSVYRDIALSQLSAEELGL